jgi:integrase
VQIREERRKDGSINFRFRYRNSAGRFISVTKKQLPYIPQSRAEAEELRPILEARFEAKKRIKQRTKEWHKKFYDFKNLVNVYEDHAKESAPNSWNSKIRWFEYYVLKFFLMTKMCSNLDEWQLYFEEFKKWLRKDDISARGTSISIASANHCINELNVFLSLMAKSRQCQPVPNLEPFPAHMVDNEKTADDLVEEGEFKEVVKNLKGIDPVAMDLYIILRETGMRLNEALGITLADVKKGDPPNKKLTKLLKENKISPIYAYIILMKQPKIASRAKGGEISWKPLKTKYKIDLKEARYIPIASKQAFQSIKRRVGEVKERFYRAEFGKEPGNYPLFYDYINKNTFSLRLKKAYERTNYRYKSPHCLRHTRATEIVSDTFSEMLAKLILGHSSKVFQRYIHFKSQLIEEAINQETSFEDF